jgi:endoglucanase
MNTIIKRGINFPGIKFGFPIFLSMILFAGCHKQKEKDYLLKLNSKDYFETRGLNIFVFSNYYNENFDDSKISGVEIIHHGVRTATNGDVRLNSTPGQWDAIPVLVDRKINTEDQTIEATLRYPGYNFTYRIKAKAGSQGITLSVILDTALPQALEGKAGLNLEFLPSAYFEKGFIMDDRTGIFPLYPGGPTSADTNGIIEPQAIAKGKMITLAPEDPERQISIQSSNADLLLFDGRNIAQNGWFVVRTLLPSNTTGEVTTWQIKAGIIEDWIKPAVIGHSQLGYHPSQKKIAVLELDKNSVVPDKASLILITSSGIYSYKFIKKINKWGDYLRYSYYTFDFSEVSEEGLYLIEFGNERTKPFRIARDIFEEAWYPTLDIFMPVQMDHMFVNEAYRVWHGASHLDDALQAPVNYKHFDLYAQGPSTDNKFKPGEHIPGLNIGGWFDAGDFDIRTQSQYSAVLNLVNTWEEFRPLRDETSIDQKTRFVDIHHPDGKPDILQQIEHGVLALIAQHRSVGYAINGIIEAHLSQYNHLGDAINKTDNRIYNPSLDSLEVHGEFSGTFDDRWAFTSRSTALNYGSAAALAAASRALKEYNPELARECLNTAVKVWDEEQSQEPFLFRHGNTTGGQLQDEELKAAAELLITTGDQKYLSRIKELWSALENSFYFNASIAIRTWSFLDTVYHEKIKNLTIAYRDTLIKKDKLNPYAVPITTTGWGGNGIVLFYGINNYWLNKAFPEIIGKEYVLKPLNYIYGNHPGSDISFVSGVGTHSKKVAYGNNRADFSFIAGGIVPGVLILAPDFPENKEDWPFLWGENEYVIGMAPLYIFLVNAADKIVRAEK